VTTIYDGPKAAIGSTSTHPDDVDGLEQYEIVWLSGHQLPSGMNRPRGAALEIVDLLGRGDPDGRGQPTVWVRGPLVEAVAETSGARLVRGAVVTVAIPEDQPRSHRRTDGVQRADASETRR